MAHPGQYPFLAALQLIRYTKPVVIPPHTLEEQINSILYLTRLIRHHCDFLTVKSTDNMALVTDNTIYFAATVLDPRIKLNLIKEQYPDTADDIILRNREYLKKELLRQHH